MFSQYIVDFLFLKPSKSRLFGKQKIKIILFSLVLLSIPIAPSSACVVSYDNSILLDEVAEVLDKIPKKPDEDIFRGKVNLTRANTLDRGLDKTIVIRAIVEESKTHPDFIGKKMMFFYHGNICDYNTSDAGDRGFAMGKALKLGSDVLYVVPYRLSYYGLEIFTESESIPLSELYPDGYW